VTSSVDPAELCIVTEYCAGGDLAQWVRRLPERRFPPAALLPLAVSLLHALEYLHLIAAARQGQRCGQAYHATADQRDIAIGLCRG
jgi:hypothetical protein